MPGRLAGLILVTMTACAAAGCAGTSQPVSAIARDSARLSITMAETLPPSASTMSTAFSQAPAPAGFISFCLRQPEQCARPDNPDALVQMTTQNWQTMMAVNRTVNAAILPADDVRHYGRAEYWSIPDDGYGDCEDYALTKRKVLAEAGMPTAALRIAIVIAPREGRHAVLTVATDRGDYVLDNLTDTILPWNRTDFAWQERQDFSHASGWIAMNAPPLQTAANTGR